MKRLFSMIPVGAVLLAGCAVGPDYQVPGAELEAAFKNAGFSKPPPEGSWWGLFGDSELNRYIRMAESDSPTARAALARYDLARGTLGLESADAWPAVTADAFGRRQKDSGNSNFSAGTYNDYRAALNVSWEVDLWGRVRRKIGAAVAETEAAGYEYRGALLSLRGEVARAYLSLRFADAEIALLERTETLRAEARRLMKARFDAGASSRIDHERSITEHESVKSEIAQLRAERGRFENALAVLVGRNASGFSVPAKSGRPAVPAPPGAVPSDLLRRRPDIAAAERRLAASSERIGLAIASYLPKLTLTGEGGFRSLSSSDLFNSGSKLWSLGPELEIPIFQGGRAFADKDRAEAAYRESLELYRDALLKAVQETEDSMLDARQLRSASDSRWRGAGSAKTAASLVRKRYEGGAIDYFEVVESERTALVEQRAALAIERARALAATRLIQALGGGWKR
ncbi:efflux transporter outer membrane subunit [Haloferula sp. A504]|uniref:efflux transporter outer membrane subunit n=1 Tax=Haloferula sp. A504 TaxID=3373601 RepID=UPI0031C9C241|nr:efflux transporter outer membrane subunit [Verrucomicrobiaceae bacterium E54]